MTGSEVFSHICDAAFERHLAFGGVAGNNICLGAHNVENYVRGEVAPELCEPNAHFLKRGKVGYAIAEDAGVCAAVVEAGYRTAVHNDVRFCLEVSRTNDRRM